MVPNGGVSMTSNKRSKTSRLNLVAEYMNEIVNYGGIRMPRHQMIAHLTHTAKATGCSDWHILVDRYLQGHELTRQRSWDVPESPRSNESLVT
jgi:hypothetical protein